MLNDFVALINCRFSRISWDDIAMNGESEGIISTDHCPNVKTIGIDLLNEIHEIFHQYSSERCAGLYNTVLKLFKVINVSVRLSASVFLT